MWSKLIGKDYIVQSFINMRARQQKNGAKPAIWLWEIKSCYSTRPADKLPKGLIWDPPNSTGNKLLKKSLGVLPHHRFPWSQTRAPQLSGPRVWCMYRVAKVTDHQLHGGAQRKLSRENHCTVVDHRVTSSWQD